MTPPSFADQVFLPTLPPLPKKDESAIPFSSLHVLLNFPCRKHRDGQCRFWPAPDHPTPLETCECGRVKPT